MPAIVSLERDDTLFDALDNVGSETECLRNFRPGGSSQLAKECCNTAMCRRLTSLAGDGGRRDNETPRLKLAVGRSQE
jgi:hypothetical protein